VQLSNTKKQGKNYWKTKW